MHKIKTGFNFLRLLVLAAFACVMPRRKRKIVFGAWFGKKFDCNPRALFEYILSADRRYECVWVGDASLKDQVLSIPGARFAVQNSLVATWHCLTCSFFVCNVNHLEDIGTVPYCGRVTILSLGHGIANKCCGVRQKGGDGRVKDAVRSRSVIKRIADWMYPLEAYRGIASDEEGKILCREFPYRYKPDTLLPCGYCRDDYMINNGNNIALKREIKEKIAKVLGIDANKRWYVYAPTWRHNVANCFSFSASGRLAEYEQILRDRNAILVEKHHPKTITTMESVACSSDLIKVFDCAAASSVAVNELLMASDLLITDYSSIYYDFALLGRPVIEFTYDYEFARDVDFGFEFDLREYAPGPFAYDEDELLGCLRMADADILAKRSKKFFGYLAYETGCACSKMHEFLEHRIGG